MSGSFISRHANKILLIAALLSPLVLVGARRALLNPNNNIKDWLPDAFQETTDLNWFQDHFPGEEFILVSWEGCTLDDPRLGQLVDSLVGPDAETNDGEPWFSNCMTGASVMEQLTSSPINLSEAEALERLHGSLIGPDGQQTCAVLTLSEAGQEDLHGSVERVLFVAQQECGIAESDLHMGGPPVDNYHIDAQGEQMLIKLGFLASIVGLALAWGSLRSLKLTIMVFTVALYGGAMSLALVYYAGGSVNAVVLTMPALIYVLGISGAIHVANYYRDALQHCSVETAPAKAIQLGWVPCTLAATSTAIGLGSLAISDLNPIRTFGIYSAWGILASLALVLVLLPAMLQKWPLTEKPATSANGAQENSLPRWCQWLFARIIRHHTAVTVVSLAGLAIMGYGVTRVTTSVQLMKLFSPSARIIHDYTWLEEHLGELVPMEIVIHVSKDDCELNFLERMDLVREVQKEVESIPAIGSSLATTTFSPQPAEEHAAQDQPAARRGSSVSRLGGAFGRLLGARNKEALERNVWNKRLVGNRDEFLAGDYLSEEGDVELWRVSARVAALKDIDYGEFVATLKAKVDPVLVSRTDRGIKGLDVTYTGLVPLVYKSQRTLMDNLGESFGTAFGLIAVMMFLLLRSPSAGLLSMLPNLFPALVVFGAMGWLGVQIDIGAMMCASVALGVGVDDTVHFLTWFRRGTQQGLDRRKAVQLAYHRCAKAMFQTTLIGGLGLAVFGLSAFTPTQRFGIFMVTLLGTALIGDLVMLPAILVGPLGRVFVARSLRKAASPELNSIETTGTELPATQTAKIATQCDQSANVTASDMAPATV
jgi:predicted RND superfamily exporter protein